MGTAETLITEHLDTWSSAVKAKATTGRGSKKKQELYGVKKLRELILELAVRGLLVPQDPEEEPASELLKRIATQKIRLITGGEIKKQPKLTPVQNDEFPFSLPSGWRFERIGNLTSKLGSGSTPRGGKSAYVPDGIIFLRSQNVWNDGLKLDDTAYIPEETHEIMQNTQVFPRDVLLNITGASLGRSTIFPKALKTANVSQHVTIIRLIEDEMAEFLHLGILSPLVQKLVWGRQVGMAIEGLSKKVLEKFEFPIPPLAEQHRIVAKVDELMALCDQLEQQQEDSLRTHDTLVRTLLGALTAASERGQFAQAWQRIESNFDILFTTESSIDQLKQTILQLAVMGKLVEQDPEDEPASQLLKKIAEEKEKLIKDKKLRRTKSLPPIAEGEAPFDEPKGWSVARFSEVCQEVATGPFGTMIHKRDYVDGGVPLINPSHLINGKIVENQSVSVSPEKAAELSSYSIYEGDIVMARRGEMGRCAVVTRAQERWLCGTGSFVLKFHSEVSRRFILLFFMSEKVRNYLGGESVGITMTNLNHGILNKLPVVLPPAKEQERIADEIERLTALCDRLKAKLNTAQTTQLNLADSLVEQAIG